MRIDEESIKTFHCPRWAELPAIPLYMDQVVIVLDGAIGIYEDDKERVITASMVNNYVKHRLLPAPEKKKYGRTHIAALIVVSILKRVLTMQEIKQVITITTGEYGIEAAYDLFCQKMEARLAALLDGETGPGAKGAADSANAQTHRAEHVMDAALDTLMGKLLILYYLGQSDGAVSAQQQAPS